jgi:small-conductance mechanosensitive channel
MPMPHQFVRFRPPSSRRGWAAWLVLLFVLILPPNAARAEQAREKPPADAEALISTQQIEETVQNALTSNRSELNDLEGEFKQLEAFQTTVQTAIKAFESQNTAHGQLLLSAKLRVGDLEKALSENRLANRTLTEQISRFQKRHDAVAIMLKQSDERIALARQQMKNIQESQFSDTQKQKLEATTAELVKILTAKNALAKRFIEISGGLLDRMNAAVAEKKDIADKLSGRLGDLKKTALFSRVDAKRYLAWGAITEALRLFAGHVALIFDLTTWKNLWARIRIEGLGAWSIFMVALTAVLVLQGRCRALLRRIELKCEGRAWYYRCLALLLVRRALVYLCMTILFGIYEALDYSLFDIGLARVLFYFFMIFLFTRWGRDYLDHGLQGPPTALRKFVTRHLKRVFRYFRTAVVILITITWIEGAESLLNLLVWDVMVIALLVWIALFWRRFNAIVAAGLAGQPAPDARKIALIRGGSYLVLGGTLLLSLLGYSSLAGHWLFAWIKTAVLVFWGWLGLNAIREWHADHEAEARAADEDQVIARTHPWRWSIIQLVRFVCLIGLAAGIVWSWDRGGYLAERLGQFIDLSFSIGKVNLSIKGILMAVVIIYLTHLGVRVGRALINKQILEKRQLERGFKDSVLTVSSYLVWGLGLLLALAVIGVNATSLAVVFGALSVGIGFGLQNIFNNFISGLILLFERPIQVGDIVEMNGLWAEVKQINVRSTVVQTFDNASVIIPNSDFISQQVTNWSFKDKRLRRNIEVGVAYGSDIDLVQKTLLEITQKHRKVLQYPKPDVVFIDHGASALVFRLRIWTHVDEYWSVPSAIRFDIDRRFRELGIEIAFPQQDIHIRSYPEEFKPRTPAPATTETPEPPVNKAIQRADLPGTR